MNQEQAKQTIPNTEVPNQSSEKGVVMTSFKKEHLKSVPDDEFLLKRKGNLCEVLQLFSYLLFSVIKPEVLYVSSADSSYWSRKSLGLGILYSSSC